MRGHALPWRSGGSVVPVREAEVILSLMLTFSLVCRSVRYAREFSKKRKVRDEHGEMNRLYVVERSFYFGLVADHG
jgi:hypothetical protein